MNEEIYCEQCGPLVESECFTTDELLEFATCQKCGGPAEFHMLANHFKFETHDKSMAKLSREQFDAHMKRLNNALYIAKIDHFKRMNDDELRERIKEISPEIRHDIKVMEDLLREIIKSERDKQGKNAYDGQIVLELNQHKDHGAQPDLVGSGTVNAVKYRAAAWVQTDGKLKLGLTNYKSNAQH